jgi:hypothetical protein
MRVTPTHAHKAPQPKNRRRLVTALLVAASCGAPLQSGCATFGGRFGPGVASTSSAHFATPPVIVHDGDQYTLSWTYGSDGYYFSPCYAVQDAALVFSLQGTTSTGSRSGRRGEIPIDDADAIAALAHGGAWWWEPDGSLTRIDVVEQRPMP